MTTTRKRALTAQIKPDTRNAIMDQLALAASEIERLRGVPTTTKSDLILLLCLAAQFGLAIGLMVAL